MRRLSAATLADVPTRVRRFAYDRERHATGIVHLGLGAFARAHLADYTDDALAAAGGDWRITGVSMRGRAVQSALAPQHGLFTRAANGPGEPELRVIGSVSGVLVAPDQPRDVMAALAAPATRIVTMTVTEKGYCQQPATGELDLAHPDVAHDLDARFPRSAIGMLAAALQARRVAGVAPFTPLPLDNLPANGARLRELVLAFARAGRGGAALAEWIAANVPFPSTMVDRIVPAATAADRDAVAAALGLRDEGVVVCEPFRQWVIEDRFAAGRPAWEAGGAEMVADVAPFERAKLRMLNASHSALAWLGLAGGLRTVDEAVASPLGAFVARYMAAEAAPALAPSPIDFQRYAADLLARFANPALAHRLGQIATDSSQKLPPRILSTLLSNRAAGRPIDGGCLIVAAFLAHMCGGAGARNVPDDPLAARFQSVAAAAGDAPEALVAALLAITEVFGELGHDPHVVATVAAKFRALRALGPFAAAAP